VAEGEQCPAGKEVLEMRKIAKTLMVVSAVVVVVWLVESVLAVWAWRSRNHRALHLVKRFNKYVENPIQVRFGGRSGPSAVVHHVGRRSGKPYATPVIAHLSQQDVVIPLPYGTDVDWLRNLLAAGRGVVDLERRSLQVDGPVIVDIDDVVDRLPASMVFAVRVNGAREALQLRVSEPTPEAV
jgi:deazaflavin-dependent oxidoreductase (nitroreductase family)